MDRSKRNLLVFFIALGAVIATAVGEKEVVERITKEDGVIENLSALFYLLGFLICGFTIFKKGTSAFLVFWCILSFVFLGEETSWFQRIFNYSVPGVESLNRQQEFNIHNLEMLHEEPIVTEKGKFQFTLTALIRPQNLMKIGFISYFLLLPFLHLIPRFNYFFTKIGYPKPSTGFLIAIWPALLLSYIFTIVFNKSNHNIVETREMLYALFILLYIIDIFLLYAPRLRNLTGTNSS